VERLGQAPPSGRQLLMLRIMGLVAPAPGAPWYLKARGFVLVLLFIAVVLAIGFGLAKLVTLPFGGAGTLASLLIGLLIVAVVFGVLALLGRRRQARARAAARAAPGG
jgi:hypothetical protein